MLKGKPLMRDRQLSRHVPVTEWYHDHTLYKMLAYYPVLYIKPDDGSAGNGVIRVKRLNRYECLVSHRNTSDKCMIHRLASEVRKRMIPRRKYIIQQGISLATYKNRPFDLRVVLQKPADRWLLTWMSAKIAPRTNSIVTNVAKGARDARIMPTLRGIDQPLNAAHLMKEVEKLSYRIADKLGSSFPFRIIGLDMAIDKNGNIWYIEANTNPNFHGLEKLDPVQYRRYMMIKRQMKARKLI
jgi:hypothetical protein